MIYEWARCSYRATGQQMQLFNHYIKQAKGLQFSEELVPCWKSEFAGLSIGFICHTKMGEVVSLLKHYVNPFDVEMEDNLRSKA